MNKSLMPGVSWVMSSEYACVAAGGLAVTLSSQDRDPPSVAMNYIRHTSWNDKAATNPGEHGKGPAPLEPKILADAANVLRAFNTWTFKREQPSDPELLLRVAAEAIAARKPIPFLLYWGKGPRHAVAPPDQRCLDFLASLAERVRGAYAPGAAMRLILTDTHAELNGHTAQNIAKYYDDIRSEAQLRGFDTCLLGQLVKSAGSLATAAPLDDVVSAKMLESLIASAQKWYRGDATPEEGAVAYLRMNLIEQRVVERAFPNSIFVTFNGSQLRPLFPRQLPIFYMYSLKRGVAVKPWFMSAEPATAQHENRSKTFADA
jgi:L-tyrosine isonitrile synthase